MTQNSQVQPATALSWWILGWLTVVYALNWMDRSVIFILMAPIAQDLNLSDSALGILTGILPSAVFAIAGFPIARLADTGSRRTIVAISAAFVSLFTGTTALAGNFLVLVATRFGISVASAGCSPAAYSLISDLFSARRRGTAIAIYSVGISVGTWVGLTAGGFITDRAGWRLAFLLCGAPGLVVATLFFLLVREPLRGRHDPQHAPEVTPSFREALKQIIANKSFLAVALGFAVISGTTSAFEDWVPTWLIRARHMSATDVGAMSGFYQGLMGVVGTLVFGVVSDRLAVWDRRWYIWTSIISMAVMVPAIWLFFNSSNSEIAPYYFVIEMMSAAYTAPLFTAGQMLLPPHLKALGMATLLFLLNMIGSGLIPTLAGYVSDLFSTARVQDGLAMSIMSVQVLAIVGIAALFYAANRLKGEAD
jgi:predicted MFS family arabinose efflux permease